MDTNTIGFDNTTNFRHIKPHIASLMRLTRNLVAMTEVVEALANDYVVSHYLDCVERNPRDAFSEAVFPTARIRDMLAEKGASCDIEQLRLMLSEFIASERFIEGALAPHRAPVAVSEVSEVSDISQPVEEPETSDTSEPEAKVEGEPGIE
jgi:hypothetical protein